MGGFWPFLGSFLRGKAGPREGVQTSSGYAAKNYNITTSGALAATACHFRPPEALNGPRGRGRLMAVFKWTSYVRRTSYDVRTSSSYVVRRRTSYVVVRRTSYVVVVVRRRRTSSYVVVRRRRRRRRRRTSSYVVVVVVRRTSSSYVVVVVDVKKRCGRLFGRFLVDFSSKGFGCCYGALGPLGFDGFLIKA